MTNTAEPKTLVEVDEKSILQAFSEPGGLDSVIERVREIISESDSDITTSAGRKHVAGLARKVASTKVAFDKVGAELVVDWKKKAKAVDEQRRHLRNELDSLRDQARAPLTEYENAEKQAVGQAQAVIDEISRLCETVGDIKEMKAALSAAVRIDTSDADKRLNASAQKAESIEKIEKAISAEAARLEMIAAKEKAEAEAAEARKKLEDELRAKQAEIDKAKAVAEAKAMAEARAEKAIADAAKAKEEAKAAEEKARIDAEANAIEKARQQEEREKLALATAELEKQRKEQLESLERAEAEKKSQQIAFGSDEVISRLKESKTDLVSVCGITESEAKRVVIAISTGKIRHIETEYIIHE